jgi:hypothetical protein
VAAARDLKKDFPEALYLSGVIKGEQYNEKDGIAEIAEALRLKPSGSGVPDGSIPFTPGGKVAGIGSQRTSVAIEPGGADRAPGTRQFAGIMHRALGSLLGS